MVVRVVNKIYGNGINLYVQILRSWSLHDLNVAKQKKITLFLSWRLF